MTGGCCWLLYQNSTVLTHVLVFDDDKQRDNLRALAIMVGVSVLFPQGKHTGGGWQKINDWETVIHNWTFVFVRTSVFGRACEGHIQPWRDGPCVTPLWRTVPMFVVTVIALSLRGAKSFSLIHAKTTETCCPSGREQGELLKPRGGHFLIICSIKQWHSAYVLHLGQTGSGRPIRRGEGGITQPEVDDVDER